MTRGLEQLRDGVNRALFRAGAQVLPRLSPGSVRGFASGLGTLAARVGTPYLDQGAENVALLTGRTPTSGERADAARSWARMYLETLALPGWSAQTLQQIVRPEPEGERRLRAARDDGGVIVALPHMANWDLAGAWAGATGLAVTTVAEHLGEAEFAAYVRLRARLGLEVIAHDDRGATAALVAAVRAGRVVCLMADRDLTGAGLLVPFGPGWARLPAGPAMVARRTGAMLLPMVPHYTASGMQLEFGPSIHPGPGRDGLTAATAEVAAYFADRIAAHPADWQVLQPFFEPTDRQRMGEQVA